MTIMIIIRIITIKNVITIINIITIIVIACVMAIMLIIAVGFICWLESVVWYTSLTTSNLYCTSFPFKESSASFLWFPSVTPTLSSTTCATHFMALQATAESAQTRCWRWMQDVIRQLVGFGMVPRHVMNLSARSRLEKGSMWTAAWRKVPCEHHDSPGFRPCCCRLWPSFNDSARFFRQCIYNLNFGPNMRLRSVRVVDLRGGKDGA